MRHSFVLLGIERHWKAVKPTGCAGHGYLGQDQAAGCRRGRASGHRADWAVGRQSRLSGFPGAERTGQQSATSTTAAAAEGDTSEADLEDLEEVRSHPLNGH